MLIRQEEAAAFRQTIVDREILDAVMIASTEVLFLEDELVGDFDMLFFCKVVASARNVEQKRRDNPLDDDVVFG